MRGLMLALLVGAALRAQAQPQDPQEPAKRDALAHFKNQLDQFAGSWAVTQQRLAAQARAARKGAVFPGPQQSRNYFAGLKSIPAAPAVEPPKGRIVLKPGNLAPSRWSTCCDKATSIP
jgi:hypothetical protein